MHGMMGGSPPLDGCLLESLHEAKLVWACLLLVNTLALARLKVLEVAE